MAFRLKVISLVLGLSSQLLLSTTGYEATSRLITILSLLTLITVEFVARRDSLRKEQLRQLYNEGADTFRDGLMLQDSNTLARSIHSLLRVADPSAGADPYLRCSAASAVALAMEKLSYAGSTRSIIITIDENCVFYRLENDGDFIQTGKAMLKMNGPALYLTIPDDFEQFENAEHFHRLAFNTILEFYNNDNQWPIKELVSVMRNYAYYLIAKNVLSGRETLDDAQLALYKARSSCDPLINHRMRDLNFMIEATKILKNVKIDSKSVIDETLKNGSAVRCPQN